MENNCFSPSLSLDTVERECVSKEEHKKKKGMSISRERESRQLWFQEREGRGREGERGRGRERDGGCDFIHGCQVGFLPTKPSILQANYGRCHRPLALQPLPPPRKRRHFEASDAPRHRDRGPLCAVPHGHLYAALFPWECGWYRPDVRALHRVEHSLAG